MAYVADLGYPVPEVFEAHGADMVMERLDGKTLTAAMLDGDVTLDRGAATLADLLRRLHDLQPWDHAAPGHRVVHLDLHPDNVMLTSRGPVVIDWCNATDAPADLDTAVSALILAQVAVDGMHVPRATAAGRFLDAFLPVAPGDPTRLLDEAGSLRARQLSLVPGETAVLTAAAARIRGEH